MSFLFILCYLAKILHSFQNAVTIALIRQGYWSFVLKGTEDGRGLNWLKVEGSCIISWWNI